MRENACKNCGNHFQGNFCNQCGEKAFTVHDKKLSHFFGDAFHFLTHFDSKFLRTLKLIIVKPGFLSREYCNGTRKRYYKPISLFLICVVLYLLFPLFKGLNMNFSTYYHSRNVYSIFVQPITKQKLQAKNISLQNISKKYNAKSPKISKLLLLLYIPLTALLLHTLFYVRTNYFYDHMMLATELNVFLVAYAFLLLPILTIIIQAIGNQFVKHFNLGIDDRSLTYIIGIPFSVVVVVAFKRFYGQKWGWTILKSLLFLTAYVTLIIPLYNIILFAIVMMFI